MVQYRRNFLPGGTYFFTVTLKNRQSNLLVKFIDELKNSYKKTQITRPFITQAFVVLPEHLHVLWQLPENDSDYSGRWREIKKRFTQTLIKKNIGLSKNFYNECEVWQRRYWEHTINSQEDFNNHVNYIHYNPVKHGLVQRVVDWPHSSFHEYVKRKILDIDWGGESLDAKINTMAVGE